MGSSDHWVSGPDWWTGSSQKSAILSQLEIPHQPIMKLRHSSHSSVLVRLRLPSHFSRTFALNRSTLSGATPIRLSRHSRKPRNSPCSALSGIYLQSQMPPDPVLDQGERTLRRLTACVNIALFGATCRSHLASLPVRVPTMGILLSASFSFASRLRHAVSLRLPLSAPTGCFHPMRFCPCWAHSAAGQGRPYCAPNDAEDAITECLDGNSLMYYGREPLLCA